MSDLLDAALRYAARGWDVFPCHTPTPDGGCSCGKADCESQGKHPRIGWKAGATTNPQKITYWWKQWPDANIGIATGERSGIVVADADGDEGRATIERNGGTNPGPQVMTGRGEHRYVTHPGFSVKNFVKHDGLDMRGDGGYVVAPPSLHASGNRYAWLNETEGLDVPAMPVWMLEMLTPEPDPLPIVAPASSTNARTMAYANAALEGELAKLSQAANGQRNVQLNNAALALGHIVGAGWLDADATAQTLLKQAQALGLPAGESKATIKSGMRKGVETPTVLDDRPYEPDPMLGLTISNKGKASKGEQSIDDANWLHRGVTADRLQHKLFAQVNWPVANILSEGATLLAGKPKSKKSWLALSIAVDVALGRPTLGGLDTKPGRVVYLDLESNQRRMQQRLRALLGNDPWPSNLHIFTDWPKGAACIARMDEWTAIYPDTILWICDILQNVRPARTKNANPYDEDYEAVQPLNAFGERHHCAVLPIHHTRKAKADDVFDEISGSTGLVAGVAGMWILGRHPTQPSSILSIRGRDIVIDDDMILTWDEYECRFKLDDTAGGRTISQERRDVYDAMDAIQVYTPKDLSDLLGKAVSVINKHLTGLFADSMVMKVGYGKYQKIPPKPKTYGLSIPSVPSIPSIPSVPSVPTSDAPAEQITPTRNDILNSEWTRNGLGTQDQGIPMPQSANSEYSERDSLETIKTDETLQDEALSYAAHGAWESAAKCVAAMQNRHWAKQVQSLVNDAMSKAGRP